ncbi:MAG: adenine deaminase [Chloroflexota bacterium]|nr:adenine deaminase [Chloroflexota bacterium]
MQTSPFSVETWRRRLRVALGNEPADLVLAGGTIVDVLAGDTYVADVAIADGVIAGIGQYPGGHERIDLTGRWLAPSFIDAHVHTESALVWVPEFARAVVPHGTGAIVTDPHEIANIAGLPGLEVMRDAARDLPMGIYFTIPSCVPASAWESPGASFGVAEIAAMAEWPECVGLGELMSFPDVLAGADGIAAKLRVSQGMRRDGHAPGLRGPALQAYVGSGPGSDHEATTYAEALEKLRAGQLVMIREGSSARNLEALLPLVTDATYPRCCFCSDDRDVHALLHIGHMDHTLRLAIELGLDPVRAIRMVTWTPAEYWRLEGWGAIAPGFQANLVVLDDLRTVQVGMTIFRGQVVAEAGAIVAGAMPTHSAAPTGLLDSVHMAPLLLRDLRLAPANAHQAVGAIPGEIATRWLQVEPEIQGDEAVVSVPRDLLKLVCVERHHATGRVGVGYVQGFGLRRGALASSIAHDAHNIVAVGTDDADILRAIAVVAEDAGGLAVVADGEVLAHMALPIAGILSDLPLAETAAAYERLEDAARSLGSTLPSPFGLLAFMALSVIPEARVTDRGFVTV